MSPEADTLPLSDTVTTASSTATFTATGRADTFPPSASYPMLVVFTASADTDPLPLFSPAISLPPMLILLWATLTLIAFRSGASVSMPP